MNICDLSNSYKLTKEWIANCCLINLDEKFNSLYRNSLSTISFTDSSFHDSSRSFWESRSSIVTRFFLLIKLSSNFVVTSIWFHQNRIFIFVLIDLSTISKINKYEKNHLDLNKSSRLHDRRTTRRQINKLMKNRRYEPSQINKCDSKSNRSCMKNAMMM
jgi:hypothetical protein